MVKVDSSGDGMWVVECATCQQIIGRKIAGDDAETVAKVITEHRCAV